MVAIVLANDPDGDSVSYAITGGNEDSNFLLDKEKGVCVWCVFVSKFLIVNILTCVCTFMSFLCVWMFAGIITLRHSPPPSLRGPQYILNITATDDNASGGLLPLSSATQVFVGINDINNNKPLFHQVRPGPHN